MKAVLLCLHGWGGSKESFTELREALKDTDITILAPDLPGFGSEPEPPNPWTVDDYADWVEQFLSDKSFGIAQDKLAISDKQLLILGHSHGGRICMKLAIRGTLPIAHMYLCASAGIRHPRHFKRTFGLMLAKTGKFFLMIPGLKYLQPAAKKLLYRLVRVHDYEKASPLMRDTLIRVTQEDFRPLLQFIHTPTDIFWGTDDKMTPVSDAYVLQRGIAGSKLHVFQGVRHRVHRDRANDIAEIIKQKLETKI